MKNDYEVRGEVTAIFLKSPKYGDMEAIIDTFDLPKAKSIDLTWCVRKHRNTFYAFCNIWIDGKKTSLKLHAFLMNSPKVPVDHKNHDGLDNRRSINLRIVTDSENQQNRKGAQLNSKSGIRGVCWNEKRKQWQATVGFNGKQNHFGWFKDVKDAEQAVKEARAKYMPYSQEALSS